MPRRAGRARCCADGTGRGGRPSRELVVTTAGRDRHGRRLGNGVRDWSVWRRPVGRRGSRVRAHRLTGRCLDEGLTPVAGFGVSRTVPRCATEGRSAAQDRPRVFGRACRAVLSRWATEGTGCNTARAGSARGDRPGQGVLHLTHDGTRKRPSGERSDWGPPIIGGNCCPWRTGCNHGRRVIGGDPHGKRRVATDSDGATPCRPQDGRAAAVARGARAGRRHRVQPGTGARRGALPSETSHPQRPI